MHSPHQKAWQGAAEEGGLAHISLAGSLRQQEQRRCPSCHPWRKGKAGCAKTAGRAEAQSDKNQRQSMGNVKKGTNTNLTEDFGFCQVVTLTLWHAGLWTLAIRQAQCIKSNETLCSALSHSRLQNHSGG